MNTTPRAAARAARRRLGLAALVCALIAALHGCAAPYDGSAEETGESAEAVTCQPRLRYYPVRGRHNNGYDSTAGNSRMWTCDAAHSNSDYVRGDHLGNDIWAAEGTPVVATVSGTLRLVAYSAYSGNKLTIVDSCGWSHFYCHLQRFGPGISPARSNGTHINAGQVVGYVGRTGSESNGVVHLHYSIYPEGDYDRGVDPYPFLHAVERAVCALPTTTPPRDAGVATDSGRPASDSGPRTDGAADARGDARADAAEPSDAGRVLDGGVPDGSTDPAGVQGGCAVRGSLPRRNAGSAVGFVALVGLAVVSRYRPRRRGSLRA